MLIWVWMMAMQVGPAVFEVAGDWAVRVEGQTLRVAPTVLLEVRGEQHDGIPMFNPKAGGWAKGAQLKGVKAQETTSPRLLEAGSFVLRAGDVVFEAGVDYELDPVWGTFGRVEGSRIAEGQTVFASYRHGQMRMDAVVKRADGVVEVRRGEGRAAAPQLPQVKERERYLGALFFEGMVKKLEAEHLFPVMEAAYPELPVVRSGAVARIVKRLEAGGPLRVLAWGDSVTDGTYLSDPKTQRWQEQFVKRLRAQYPKAQIELLTQAWGGRNTGSYLAEPAGSVHHYGETVLGVKPDLVVSEFVNDAGLKPEQVQERYGKLLKDFQGIGAEWIILTPHYVRPDWMGLTRQKEIDEDPRGYVAGLRQFAATHDVGLADASLRYGRLWRQGVPYNTLMLNAINHPDERGMRLFADALMALFR
jgi:lysophospholipase L1-like esterase